jgi:hypothetical protein
MPVEIPGGGDGGAEFSQIALQSIRLLKSFWKKNPDIFFEFLNQSNLKNIGAVRPCNQSPSLVREIFRSRRWVAV